MSAATAVQGRSAGCLLLLLIAYLVIGLVVYAAAYGEPSGFTLTLFLVVILWPCALFWWSLPWILYTVILLFAAYGVKRLWDDL